MHLLSWYRGQQSFATSSLFPASFCSANVQYGSGFRDGHFDQVPSHDALHIGSPFLYDTAAERKSDDVSPSSQIAIGSSLQGDIQSAGEQDRVKVSLTAGTTYEFRVLGEATGVGTLNDPQLNLFDQSGNWVTIDWDAGAGLDPWLTFTPQRTGDYYLAITSYDRESTGTYELTSGLSPKPVFSQEQIVDQLTRSEVKWDQPVISFSFFEAAPGLEEGYFSPGGPEESNNEPEGFSACTPAQMALVREALNLWAEVCGITLVDLGVGSGGDIRFGNTTTGPEFAWGYLPGDGVGGDVWFQPDFFKDKDFGGTKPGTYGFNTLLHEIGHALGFLHPGDYDFGEEGFVDYSPEAEYVQDTVQYSLMSYFQAHYTGADHSLDDDSYAWDTYIWGATPLLHDILALQAMFGLDLETRSTDTVYGFNSTSEHDSFNFKKFDAPVVAIWDAGGVDTLDLSGFAQDAAVSLKNGAFSSAGGLTSNIAISAAVSVGGQVINIIENAVGGSGNDHLYGNRVANVLTGGRGNDTLLGYGGDDTLYGGASDDQFLGGVGSDTLCSGRGNDTLQGQAGTDTLIGGAGRDTLSGGALVDRFVYLRTNDSGITSATRDYISDFAQFGPDSSDKIDLSAIDAISGGADDAFRFVDTGGAAVTSVATGCVSYYWVNLAGVITDHTIVILNNDADTALEMTIEIHGLIKLDATDFLL